MDKEIGLMVKTTLFTFVTLIFATSNLNASQWTKVAKGANFYEYYGNVSKSGRIASLDCLRDYIKESIQKTQTYLSRKNSLKFDENLQTFGNLTRIFCKKYEFLGAFFC